MSFQAPVGMRSFFNFDSNRMFARSIEPKRELAPRFLLFDAYYCCLLLGLDARHLGDEKNIEQEKFLDSYPDSYKGQAELIAGLLVDAELTRREVASDNRTDIERVMVRLLDLTSSTRLSAEGDRLLNRYAASGFDRIRETITSPENLEDFLVAYYGIWKEKDTHE
ncbi:hypothetical protein [Pseudomonas fluorescens]|uniref:Uncharacterized protein n=1 Tax=Pseudomonas fluorescens TaxID=294 RepID=A0A423M8K5_PSEFL|nr:hypothetical protein [Pseudomonas fluorescens]RON79115.1 hypothetical protein BK670_16505 [Pseudomonas fluorescens]